MLGGEEVLPQSSAAHNYAGYRMYLLASRVPNHNATVRITLIVLPSRCGPAELLKGVAFWHG
jgi:hypothetical protein